MNPLTYWNRLRWAQLNEQEDLQYWLQSCFDHSGANGTQEQARVAQWTPLVDLSEDEAGYVLRVELPRVKQEDAKLALEDGTLTITGDRKFEVNGESDNSHEQVYARFAHRFALPADACPAKINAQFRKGVFTVHVARNGNGSLGQVEDKVRPATEPHDPEQHSSGFGISEQRPWPRLNQTVVRP